MSQNNHQSRSRIARSDCTLDRLKGRVYTEYGVPRDALKFVLPGGRQARKDKRFGELRRDYGGCMPVKTGLEWK